MVTRIRVLCAVLLAALLAGCGGGGATATRPERGGRSGAVFTLTSEAFTDGGRIPDEYVGARAGGRNRSMPLRWSGAPEGRDRSCSPSSTTRRSRRCGCTGPSSASLRRPRRCPRARPGRRRCPRVRASSRTPAGAKGYGGPAAAARQRRPPVRRDRVRAVGARRSTLPAAADGGRHRAAVAGKVIDTAELTGIYGR